MSLDIWTQCGGKSELRPLGGSAYRVVEAQHQVSTRSLVDSVEEQKVLEDLIDAHKPPLPSFRTQEGKSRNPEEFAHLHYLLFTPFRYRPFRHGSRFGKPEDPGIWYGARELRTAFAETAYYLLVFLEGTTATLEPLTPERTSFQVALKSSQGVDLTAEPFLRYRSTLAARDRYDATQSLGRAMRDDGVQLFLYPSARDARGGTNVGVMQPSAFALSRPRRFRNWSCAVSRARVDIQSKDLLQRRVFSFLRSQFEVDGRLPQPAS